VAAAQQAFGQAVGYGCAVGYDRDLSRDRAGAIAGVVVAPMLGGPGGLRGVAARDGAAAKLESSCGAVGAGAKDGPPTRTEEGQIAPGVDQSARAASAAKGIDRAIHGVTLGDAAEIDTDGRPAHDPAAPGQVEITDAAVGGRQAGIEDAVGAAMQSSAEREHLPGPRMDGEGHTAGSRAEGLHVAAALGMHEALDQRYGLEGRGETLLSRARPGSFGFDRHERTEARTQSVEDGGRGLHVVITVKLNDNYSD